MTIHLIHGIHSNGAGLTGQLAPFFRDAGFDVMVRRYGYVFATPAIIPGWLNWRNERRAAKLAQIIQDGDAIVW